MCRSFILLRFSVPKVKNSLDTIDYILQNKCSVSRFGDGEFLIMQGWHIGFKKEDIITRITVYKEDEEHDAGV